MIIDNIFLLIWGTHGTQVVKGYKKRSSGNFLVHFISPWQNLPIWLVLMFSIISKSTSFLLKLDIHCKLPNFMRVSNTSVWSLAGLCSVLCTLLVVQVPNTNMVNYYKNMKKKINVLTKLKIIITTC